MIRLFIVGFCTLAATYSTLGQNWIGLGDGLNRGVWAMYNDPLNDELIVGGFFKDVDSSFVNMGLTKWNGSAWVDMGCGLDWDCVSPLSPGASPEPPTSFIRYQGELYMAGRFTLINGDTIEHLAKWDGISWSNVGGGVNDVVMDLEIIDDTLFVAGGFTDVGGLVVNGLARWDGNNWHDGYGLNSSGGYTPVNCVTEYLDDIYIGGQFAFGNISRLAKWDGATWSAAGGGIVGTPATVWDIKVYNDRLYVGGTFSPPANAGTGIIAWDGSQWDDLEGGLYSLLLQTGTCWDMEIWNNKLVVAGGFREAGGIPAEMIAVWDDTTWCATDDTVYTFEHIIHNVAIYHDSLFIGGNWTYIGGDRIPKIAKLNASNISDSCSLVTNIWESVHDVLSILVYPNPANDQLNIRWATTAKRQLVVYDITGRVIWQMEVNDQSYIVEVADWPRGQYFLEEQSEKGRLVQKFVLM